MSTEIQGSNSPEEEQPLRAEADRSAQISLRTASFPSFRAAFGVACTVLAVGNISEDSFAQSAEPQRRKASLPPADIMHSPQAVLSRQIYPRVHGYRRGGANRFDEALDNGMRFKQAPYHYQFALREWAGSIQKASKAYLDQEGARVAGDVRVLHQFSAELLDAFGGGGASAPSTPAIATDSTPSHRLLPSPFHVLDCAAREISPKEFVESLKVLPIELAKPGESQPLSKPLRDLLTVANVETALHSMKTLLPDTKGDANENGGRGTVPEWLADPADAEIVSRLRAYRKGDDSFSGGPARHALWHRTDLS